MEAFILLCFQMKAVILNIMYETVASRLFTLGQIQGEQQAVNSDLSSHELPEAGWEGQGGDDHRDHGRKDEPAGRENNNTNA